MTKEEILERYLNTVYFGNGAYGVQAGGRDLLRHRRRRPRLGQAALLAGLIRNPNAYDPIRHPEVANERRHMALRAHGARRAVITEAELASSTPRRCPTELQQCCPRPTTTSSRR